ncbi:hypothetical protein TWF481_009308 [Arthrobotrys musiformis]|uniref:Uncharacterized protein n=1 Tax=Arthrobotrys musiformis TaxID=47236 RepID=A0AAV9W541_9PEZI
MATKASAFALLMLLAYPAYSFRIAFYDPSVPGGPLDFKKVAHTSFECNTIPRNKITGEQKVDEIVVQIESTTDAMIAFYAVSNNPNDAPCAKQNLQIVAVFHRDMKANTDQFFTPIWPKLLYFRRIQKGSIEWVGLNGPLRNPGDVMNRSASGWLVEKKEIETRQSRDIDPSILQLVQQNAPRQQEPEGPQLGQNTNFNAPTMAPVNQAQPRVGLQIPPDSIRLSSTLSGYNVLKEQVSRLANHYKTDREVLKTNPELELDWKELEPLALQLANERQLADDKYIDSLGPQGFTAYLKELGGYQATIGQKGGYMTVPPGIRHRFSAKRLNRLGFNVIPKEELKGEIARQRNPQGYSRRFAGIGRGSLIGGIVPTISDWEETGGMMSLNPQVQSPRRVTVIDDDNGVIKTTPDTTDLNGDLQGFLTREELRIAADEAVKHMKEQRRNQPNQI